jgi:hypothetical protein
MSRKLPFFLLLAAHEAMACTSCGFTSSFTPKMLVITLSFALLPFSFAAFIAWKVWRDYKRSD